MSRRDARALRDEVAQAIDRGKFKRALECILELEQLEPRDASWPKRAAEVYRRLNKSREAIAAYERAAERYAQGGFLVQAIAVCKQILQIDPNHSATLRRLAQIAEERRTGPTGVAALNVASDAIPELTVGRNTGPITAVDPATIMQPERPVDMLEVGARRSPSMEVAAQAAPGSNEPNFTLPDEDGVPRAEAPPSHSTGRVRRVSPPPVPRKRLRQSTPPVAIPKGKPIDTVDLAQVMPGAEAERRDDGLSSGIIVIPLDDVDDSTGPIDIVAVNDDFREDTVEVSADAVESWDGEPEEISVDDLPALSSPELPAHVDLPAPRTLSAPARRALRSTPLLSGLDGEQLEALIARIELVQLEAGQILFREGDVGDSLFIVCEGEVAVISEGPPRKELSRLLPGSFFGEIALITELPRSATIAAVTRTELLAIDRNVVRALVAEHPDTLRIILRFIRNRLVERVIQTSPLFAAFSEPDRRALAEQFDFLEVEPGTKLVQQGARPEGLFVILAGRAVATRTHDGQTRTVGALATGEVFGESSLWSSEVSPIAVAAEGKVLALRMPAITFREVIMTHPQVLAYVGDLAAARRRQLDAAGDVVDLKLDLI